MKTAIAINRNLPLNRCWEMVNRIDNPEKFAIAKDWLMNNDIISNDEYDELMMAASYLLRDYYSRCRWGE